MKWGIIDILLQLLDDLGWSCSSSNTPNVFHFALLQISAGAFSSLGPKIKSLYLEKNKMQHLPDLRSFTALEILNLRDIPFNCDCQLLPLRK